MCSSSNISTNIHSKNKSKAGMKRTITCIQSKKETKNVNQPFTDHRNLPLKPQHLSLFIFSPETINTLTVLMEINGYGQQTDMEEQKKNHHECWWRGVLHPVSG